MTHLDEGTILALRDGTPVEGADAVQEHLDACPRCAEALEAARAMEARVADALTALDGPVDLETARQQVRARVTLASAEAAGAKPLAKPLARPFRPMASLRWAAGLVLVTGAAAYAVPGSPLRAWVEAVLDASAQPGPVGPVAPALETAGVRVTVTAPVRVSILGLAPGEELTVTWVPGSEVALFADSQSRFTSGTSLVQATVSHGPVRVELPADVRPLTLEVGGRIWLRNLEGGLEMPVDPVEDDGRFLRFVAPGVGGS